MREASPGDACLQPALFLLESSVLQRLPSLAHPCISHLGMQQGTLEMTFLGHLSPRAALRAYDSAFLGISGFCKIPAISNHRSSQKPLGIQSLLMPPLKLPTT